MTMLPEFKEFSKIPKYNGYSLIITQKLHGTNGQLCVYQKDDELDLVAGSRSRWLDPQNDNYGFALWAENNREFLIQSLGLGRHYGEWAGPGINSGEGLANKNFFLFDTDKYTVKLDWTEHNLWTVPLLFKVEKLADKDSAVDIINAQSTRLKTHGSAVAPSILKDGKFMNVEGLVITLNGCRSKYVFSPEETAWKSKKKVVAERAGMLDVSHLLQPMRLEKLISKDEQYIRLYPGTISDIAKAYCKDLEDEFQLSGDEDTLKQEKKALGKAVFNFIKEFFLQKYSL